ncbi:EAL domain-containing protein [Clostridium sp. Mt-5]|uniref:EAL domain-containing protein n=1 Tax=Clostridium moutaii TaxID=3240932 RepID=A0ABV4BRK3_9CLOT
MSIEDKNFILNNINETIMRWNMDKNEFLLSKSWENITGYFISPKMNFFEELVKTIYPDDIEMFDEILMKCICEKIYSFECEYRIITKSHRIKWMLHRGKILKNSEKCNLMIGFISDITDKKIYELEIRYLAYNDVLTDIPNKLLLITKLNDFFNKSSLDDKKKMALFYIDVDNFEKINNIHTTEFGDNVLKKISDTLKSVLGSNSRLYKVDQSKFAIMAYNCKGVENVSLKARYILNLFNRLVEIDGIKIFITLSLGVCMCTKDTPDTDKIMRSSDMALINAKKLGGNQYKIYNPKMNFEIIKKVEIENELRKAIINKEFILYYQPQVDITSGKLYGLEALIRWNCNGSIRLPSYFIDIAEQNGMINEIGKFVLYESCNQMKKFNILGYNSIYVSVNISEKQLEEDSFLNFIDFTIKSTGINSKYLCFEITERILMDLSKKILDRIFKIKEMGIKIFIDDFGTKYSSLNYLRDLPIDGIKIDKSFIDNIQNFGKDMVILRSIVNLALDLNIEVVAEGVEIEEQLNCLKDIGCSKIQGFIFSKPMSSKKLVQNLESGYIY